MRKLISKKVRSAADQKTSCISDFFDKLLTCSHVALTT